ncbi:YlxM family DNA-binding protein [Tepidibacter formicigenes]|jgi:predicted DNA-binding protein YlxM (UPF0122 family)|uniref:UPF0122 protein SAMN02744037_01673 n=1 Tax=Tepidibacter formicigenes DSM 15518 TaxID=1123349 RepID=A0A1M6PWA4_9FIRM|nr:putative DNA-binding protein [Tepidibacter formicigenes]SHK12176.1 hypothetical protein SAMN02744037_01673 [Tepidibacter formicigenes DSM 15518]
MNLDKVIEVSILFDFYKELLTEKQREVINFYYNEDYSLGEISENLNVSRQGIYDTLKRAEKILQDYEKKLQLVKKFNERNKYIEDIYKELVNIKKEIKSGKDCTILVPKIENLEEICRELLG